MKYAVAVTTAGREGVLERTLASLDARIRPRPAEGFIVDDSGDAAYRMWLESVANDRGWRLVYHPMRLGAAQTNADAWKLAAEAAHPWILFVPDGYSFVRPVSLLDVAYVMERQPQLAQLAFIGTDGVYADRGAGNVTWREAVGLPWMPGPCLFRRELAARYPWPAGSYSDVVYGSMLAATHSSLGVWGAGRDPFVLKQA